LKCLDSLLKSGDVDQSAVNSTHFGLGSARMMILTTMNMVVVIMMMTMITTRMAELTVRDIMYLNDKI
jgi:cell division protein FtsL